jgi:hypothetical protein
MESNKKKVDGKDIEPKKKDKEGSPSARARYPFPFSINLSLVVPVLSEVDKRVIH